MRKPTAIIISCLVLVFLGLGITSSNYYQQQVDHSTTPLLPMTFAHKDHGAQQCKDCHHNYVDNTGSGPCIICHQTDPSVNFKIRTQFHDLCEGCHIEQQQLHKKHGPTRSCLGCHTPDFAP